MFFKSLIKTIVYSLFCLFILYTPNLLGTYTLTEECELGLAIANLPLNISTKLSTYSKNKKSRFILNIITDAAQTAVEILHMINQPKDARSLGYANITYNLTHLCANAKKLYDFYKQPQKEPAIKVEEPPAHTKILRTLCTIILPIIESGTVIYRAANNTNDVNQQKNRLIADEIGAIARSFESILENEKTSFEQILTVAYCSYTLFFIVKHIAMDKDPSQPDASDHSAPTTNVSTQLQASAAIPGLSTTIASTSELPQATRPTATIAALPNWSTQPSSKVIQRTATVPTPTLNDNPPVYHQPNDPTAAFEANPLWLRRHLPPPYPGYRSPGERQYGDRYENLSEENRSRAQWFDNLSPEGQRFFGHWQPSGGWKPGAHW